MRKTASQIADEVLAKISAKLPEASPPPVLPTGGQRDVPRAGSGLKSMQRTLGPPGKAPSGPGIAPLKGRTGGVFNPRKGLPTIKE